jgi:methyl-accepting chemotaxis protein
MSSELNPKDNRNRFSDRVEFNGLDEKACALIRDLWPVVERHLPAILDSFYAHVKTIPALARLVGNRDESLKGAQTKHWQNLFRAEFDDEYAKSVTAIGRAHHRIDLEPKWYMGGYLFVLSALTDVICKTYRFSPSKCSAAIAAVQKAVFMDMDVALSVYFQAMLEDSAHKGNELDKAIAAFSDVMIDALKNSRGANDSLAGCATALAQSAAATLDKAGAVAHASQETSASAQASAAATEELSASIREIGGQAEVSARTAGEAVEQAHATQEAVETLSSAASEIGEVIAIITDIANQTNLLALNATIEAARAGEAGRGFAVVASEVKELAGQTAKATDEISQKIALIQSATTNAVGNIERIASIISEVSSAATAIASAVEEQGSATSEIARNVQAAASHSSQVASDIAEVQTAAQSAQSAGTQVDDESIRISTQGQRMETEFDGFLRSVRKVLDENRKEIHGSPGEWDGEDRRVYV